MKNVLKKPFIILLMLFLLISLVGCKDKNSITTPTETTINFLNALKRKDLTNSLNFIQNGIASNTTLNSKNNSEKEYAQAYFSTLEYSLKNIELKGTNLATINLTTSAVDLNTIMVKYQENMLERKMHEGLLGKTSNIDDDSVEGIYQYVIEAIKNSDNPKYKTNIVLTLTKNDKGWLIKEDKELLKLLHGNLEL